MKIYNEKVFWDMYYYFNLKNLMQVPFIYKVILNSCCGKFFLDKKKFNLFFLDFSYISYQKPLFVKSKKSISEFKLKKNDNLSLKVTLRKKNMYDFLYKFLVIYLPLIKNFKGLSKNSFDSFGNYSLGLEDYSIFFESQNSNIFDFTVGFNINIIFKFSNFLKSFSLLKFLCFPFKNE